MRLCLAPRLPRRGGGPGGCGRGSRVQLCPTRQGRCWAWGPSLGCRWSTACAECGCCSGLRSCTASGCSVVPGSAGVRVVRSLGQARSFRQPVHSSTRVSGLSGSLPGLLVGLPPLLGLTKLAGSRLPSRRFDCVGVRAGCLRLWRRGSRAQGWCWCLLLLRDPRTWAWRLCPPLPPPHPCLLPPGLGGDTCLAVFGARRSWLGVGLLCFVASACGVWRAPCLPLGLPPL